MKPEEKRCYVCGSSKHMATACDRPKKDDPPAKGGKDGKDGKVVKENQNVVKMEKERSNNWLKFRIQATLKKN